MKPKQNQKKDKNNASKRDTVLTPPHAIEPLLPLIPKEWIVWECANGPERLMEKAFQSYSYTVYGTDLMYGEDQNFFTYRPKFYYDVIITNPPWSLKYEWIARCLDLGKPFALLVPYETVAAGKLQKLCKAFSVVLDVLAPERRINFKMPEKGWGRLEWDEKKQKMVMRGDSAQMPTVWITWGLGVTSTYNKIANVYATPMRSVKYDENNQEIPKNGISCKS